MSLLVYYIPIVSSTSVPPNPTQSYYLSKNSPILIFGLSGDTIRTLHAINTLSSPPLASTLALLMVAKYRIPH